VVRTIGVLLVRGHCHCCRVMVHGRSCCMVLVVVVHGCSGGRSMVVVVVVVARPARLDAHQLRGNARKVFVLLFELHSPVLEPDLDLPLGEQQIVRYLDAPPSRQITIVVELLLQFQRLKARVRRPLAFRFAHRVDTICVWV